MMPEQTPITSADEITPEQGFIAMLRIARIVAGSFFDALDDPTKPVEWSKPVTGLRYDIPCTFVGDTPKFSQTADTETLRLTIGHLTDLVEIHVTDGKSLLHSTKGTRLDTLLNESGPDQRNQLIQEIQKEIDATRIHPNKPALKRILKGLASPGILETPGTKEHYCVSIFRAPLSATIAGRPWKGVLCIQFMPLTIDHSEQIAYVPVVVQLYRFAGVQLADLDSAGRADVRDLSLLVLDAMRAELQPDLLPPDIPKVSPPEVSPIPDNDKRSPHLDYQFQRRTDPATPADITTEPATPVTVKYLQQLSIPAQTAIDAIAVILDSTDYHGHDIATIEAELRKRSKAAAIPGLKVYDPNKWRSGTPPVIMITPAQYYEAYGCKKYKTARGWMEYSGHEKEKAKKGLDEIAHTTVDLTYGYDPKFTKPRIKLVDTIIDIIYLRRMDADELEYIIVKPKPAFHHDIGTYFAYRPHQWRGKISEQFPDSPALHTLTAMLFYEGFTRIAKKRKEWTVKLSCRIIAEKLSMHAWIERRQWKRITDTITALYESMLQLDINGHLITGYEIEPRGPRALDAMHHIKLNPEYFYKLHGKQITNQIQSE